MTPARGLKGTKQQRFRKNKKAALWAAFRELSSCLGVAFT
jgi:hypothetical protein